MGRKGWKIKKFLPGKGFQVFTYDIMAQGSYHVPAIVAMLEKIYRSDTMSLLYIW
jgi:hypothetical protein